MAKLHHEPMTNWTKISLSGKITYEATQTMKSQAETMLAQMGESPFLVCDVSRVTFLDSSGIGFLVFLNNKVRQQDGSFFLFQPTEAVVKTLELVQLLSFFEFIEDESELIMSLPV